MSTEFHAADEVQIASYDRTLMRRLLGYVRPYRIWFALAVVCLLGASVLSNAVPYLTMRTIDGPIKGVEREAIRAEMAKAGAEALPALEAALAARIAADRSELLGWMAILGILLFGEMTFRFTQLIIVSYIGQITMMAMRIEIFAHLQRMSLRFLDSHPVGRLMTRVTSDVEKIQQSIVTGMVQVASDLFSIVIILAYMFYINWSLALMAIIPVPLILIVSVLFRKFARDSYLEIRKKIAWVNANMQENVSGVRVVQIFDRTRRNLAVYEKLNAAHRDEWLRQVRNFAVYFPVVDFLSTFAIALIVWYGGRQIVGDSVPYAGASFGMLLAYVQYAERLFQPIKAIADRYNLLLEAMASSERIFQLLDTPEEIEDPPEPVRPATIEGRIEYREVTFGYQPGVPILQDFNLSIEPGEKIAVVGHTGAGKTTLTALLSRFYDVQQGTVFVDGIDVRRWDRDYLRRNIGTVLQDVFLFSGTIEQNIRLGDETMSDAWVRECAEYVNAARFIERLPGGYGFQVGERGVNLSTGQRQLLAFARTIAHQPRILVLDEATSSVDTETESLIQDAIQKLMEGRTAIVVAHRLSTIQNADRILVMHHGHIAEMGSHRELLALGGLYHTLYQLQYQDQD